VIWGTILMGISFADSFELSLSIFMCIVLALATIKGVNILGGKKTVMMSFLILIAGIVGYMCDGLNAAEIAAGGIDSYNPCGCGHIQKSAFNNREDCR